MPRRDRIRHSDACIENLHLHKYMQVIRYFIYIELVVLGDLSDGLYLQLLLSQ